MCFVSFRFPFWVIETVHYALSCDGKCASFVSRLLPCSKHRERAHMKSTPPKINNTIAMFLVHVYTISHRRLKFFLFWNLNLLYNCLLNWSQIACCFSFRNPIRVCAHTHTHLIHRKKNHLLIDLCIHFSERFSVDHIIKRNG